MKKKNYVYEKKSFCREENSKAILCSLNKRLG